MDPINNPRGQALIETLLTLLIFLGGFGALGFMIYSQYWMNLTEHLVHEAMICEDTLGAKFCLIKANLNANRAHLFGSVLISKNKSGDFRADFLFFESFQWKHITINKKPQPAEEKTGE